MKALKTVLAGSVAFAAMAVATPASAQYYPGYGSGSGEIIGQVLSTVIGGGGIGVGGSYGSPYGYGSGYGSPYGSGYGSPYGSGYGSPYGSGYGSTYGYGYGSPSPYGGSMGGYGSGYGSRYGGSGQANQAAVSQCMGAVQQKLNANYARSGATQGARVLGVSDVQRRSNGGTLVSGVANSGRSGGYGYANQQQQVDLTFTCKTDSAGYVSSVEIGQAEYVNGQAPAYSPYGTDYSQYGYTRY